MNSWVLLSFVFIMVAGVATAMNVQHAPSSAAELEAVQDNLGSAAGQ
jgi:hypothetical protein